MTNIYKNLSERERFVVALMLMKEKRGYETKLTLRTIRNWTCYTMRELRKIVDELVDKKIITRKRVRCGMLFRRHLRSKEEFHWLSLNGIALNPDMDIRGD
jgi:hypothetical protein